MRVYLDNNATTFMRPEVKEAMMKDDLNGNASSMYTSGRIAAECIRDARQKVGALVGTSMENVIFTSGATESNNTVLSIAANMIRAQQKGKILTTSIEHPAIHEMCKVLAKSGIKVVECSVDENGRVDLDELESDLKAGDVVLTSVMTANNETGTIQPVKEACELAHKYGSLFHTDATQAMGKMPFGFDECGFDYASISAHKFYGPKGIGALIVKQGAPYETFLVGGHQENGKRAGTYNSNAIYGMGVAADYALKEIEQEASRLSAMRDRLRKGIEEKVPDVSFNGDEAGCLPGTLNVSFKNVEGESILLMLDFDGIEVSTGSACATGSLEPSYVLLASGIPVEDAHSSIRFSFGRYNTDEDVDYVLEKLPPIIERLREISTRGAL